MSKNSVKTRRKIFELRVAHRIAINKLMLKEDTLDAAGLPTLKELMKEFIYDDVDKEYLYL